MRVVSEPEEVIVMSVLSDLIRDREMWHDRQKALVMHHKHIITAIDWGALVGVGLCVYFYHSRILLMLRPLFTILNR